MGGCKWSFLESGQQHNRMKGKNMANLIIVCGPQAVGKMTVAESLRDKLKYNMMMNHDSIEISDKIFGFATPAQKEFNYYIREKAFQLAVKHNVDMIFTYVAAFELQKEFDNHIKIDNTNLSPDEVADMVIERYHIAANEKDEKEYRYGI